MCAARHAVLGIFLGLWLGGPVLGSAGENAPAAPAQAPFAPMAMHAAVKDFRALPAVGMQALFADPAADEAAAADADAADAAAEAAARSAALALPSEPAAAQRPRIPPAQRTGQGAAPEAEDLAPEPRPAILQALYPAAGPAPTPAAAPAPSLPRPAPSQATKQAVTAATRLLNAELKGGSASEEAERMAAEFSVREQRRLFDSVLTTLESDQRLGLRSLEYSVTPRAGGAPDLSLTAIRPLGPKSDDRSASFAQFSLTRAQGSGTTYNAGIAHRRILDGGIWMVGGNLFYDYAPRYGHRRLSVGFDAMTEHFTLSANRYVPQTGWRPGRPGYEERVLAGQDIEIAGTLPGAPALRLTGKAWHWTTQEGADLHGDELGIEYRPSGLMTLRLATRASNTAARQTVATMQVSYQLGVPLAQQLEMTDAPAGRLSDRLYEKVRRENAIRTEERLIDVIAPSGYAIAFGGPLDDASAAAATLMLTGAEVGTRYRLAIFNPTNPALKLRSEGRVDAPTMQLGGLDLSTLADGRIEAQLDLTDRAGNTGTLASTVTNKATARPAGATLLAEDQAVNIANQAAFSFEVETGTTWKTFQYQVISATDPQQVITGRGTIDAEGVLCVDDIDLKALPDGTLTIAVTLAGEVANTNALLTFRVVKDSVAPKVTMIELPEVPGNAGA